jgi:hypothetical protein
MPPEVIAEARGPIVALVHHPLCLETGLPPGRQAKLKASEAAALALARHVVVTSATTARTLATGSGPCQRSPWPSPAPVSAACQGDQDDRDSR